MSYAAVTMSVIPFTLRRTSDFPVHQRSAASYDGLFARVAGGDRDAFSDLYDQLSSLVYGLALRTTKSRALAEEVTQEVFIQVWRQADRFDASQGSARSWVATLAHRRSVDVVRKTQSSTMREEAQAPDGPRPDIADQVVEMDERSRVRAAMGGLTDLQREAIELAYFGGLTYRQVAEHLNAPVGTIKTRMRDGLARMRATMERGDD